MEWVIVLIIYGLMGIVLALPVFFLRRAIARSYVKWKISLLLLPAISFYMGFSSIAYLDAQTEVIFTCRATSGFSCGAYAEEAGLSTIDEFEELAAKEILWRNVIPPLFQKDCHITETKVCDVLASHWTGNNASASGSALLVGLFSSGVTAVATLYFYK